MTQHSEQAYRRDVTGEADLFGKRWADMLGQELTAWMARLGIFNQSCQTVTKLVCISFLTTLWDFGALHSNVAGHV